MPVPTSPTAAPDTVTAPAAADDDVTASRGIVRSELQSRLLVELGRHVPGRDHSPWPLARIMGSCTPLDDLVRYRATPDRVMEACMRDLAAARMKKEADQLAEQQLDDIAEDMHAEEDGDRWFVADDIRSIGGVVCDTDGGDISERQLYISMHDNTELYHDAEEAEEYLGVLRNFLLGEAYHAGREWLFSGCNYTSDKMEHLLLTNTVVYTTTEMDSPPGVLLGVGLYRARLHQMRMWVTAKRYELGEMADVTGVVNEDCWLDCALLANDFWRRGALVSPACNAGYQHALACSPRGVCPTVIERITEVRLFDMLDENDAHDDPGTVRRMTQDQRRVAACNAYDYLRAGWLGEHVCRYERDATCSRWCVGPGSASAAADRVAWLEAASGTSTHHYRAVSALLAAATRHRGSVGNRTATPIPLWVFPSALEEALELPRGLLTRAGNVLDVQGLLGKRGSDESMQHWMERLPPMGDFRMSRRSGEGCCLHVAVSTALSTGYAIGVTLGQDHVGLIGGL